MKFKYYFILLSIGLILIFGFSSILSAQNNNNNDDENNNTLFDNDDENNNTLFDNDDENNNTLFDNDSDDDDDDNNIDIDNIDIDIPEIEYLKTIKIGLGSGFIFNNADIIEEIFGSSEAVPLYTFHKPSVISKFAVDMKYMGFSLNSDVEVYATFNDKGNPTLDLNLNELYAGFINNWVNIKIGQFIIDWGKADRFKINNFFAPPVDPLQNPYTEHTQLSVGGVWATFFINSIHASIDVVFTPYARFEVTPADVLSGIEAMANPLLDIIIEDNAPDFAINHSQSGFRFGITFAGIDLYLMYYNGFYNQTQLYTTELDTITNPMNLTFKREYEMIHALGITTAFSINKLSIRVENNFVLDMPVVYGEDVTTGAMGTFTNKILDHSLVISYTVGFDIELFTNFVLLFEYSDLWITKDITNIDYSMMPETAKNLMLIINYNFLENMLQPFIIVSYNYQHKIFSTGAGLTADFLNGFYIDLGFTFMTDFQSDISASTLSVMKNSFILVIKAYYQL